MIKKPDFLKLVKDGGFERLFTEELGWDRYKGRAELPTVSVDGSDFRFRTIADRSGFQIIRCDVDEIPTQSLARKLDSKLRRQAQDYICIFRKNGTAHDLWMVPVRANEKRELVMVEYTDAKAEVIYQKIDGITFDFSEKTNIVDLRQKVQGAFVVNSEKITKDFYSGFRKEHKAFAELISGIDDHIVAKDNRNKQWYASVMLNRLMFCYFIQKKGFLDLDTDYLRHKLDMVQSGEGSGSFYNFYRSFLRVLFHDGLNAPKHDRAFEKTFGRIPYLNGGMFDHHQLEQEFPDIDIPDEAFRSLFDFFDKWNWHLDTRLTASGKDINPDVLGYIFEQYINDRAQMGAYYTKEDITEYIGKNCILPFLMDRVKEKLPEMFTGDGYVWTKLRESGDRYIYDAVRKGYSPDWRKRIPEEIVKGIITEDMRKEYRETPVGDLPEGHVPLAELRKNWNRRTPEEFALPTEIWRETIERFERCDGLRTKISKGEVHEINDFITLNLDIRSFVFDLLNDAEDHRFVAKFYKSLQSVSILDPTCGSGAFLFAAMNILEPLYEVCIERMQEFNARNPKRFKEELAEITNKYRSNIQYFIYKSIILRNLYGVDIMVEATEIAKLRLFLKMVAVVDVDRKLDNLGLDPLPDIDFNIRCGNTLVGYANEKQLTDDLTNHNSDWVKDGINEDFKPKIDNEMVLVAMAYKRFRQMQFVQEVNMEEFKTAKNDLHSRLSELNGLLNNLLFESSGNTDYKAWLSSHQPFNWLAEFYQIIHDNGGFDVIIGNPPYVEYSKKDKTTGISTKEMYRIKNYITEPCDNLYAFVIERGKQILSSFGFIGFIVPLSGHSTSRMESLSKLYQEFDFHMHFNLSADANPQKLFEGVKFRLCIFFGSNTGKGSFTSKYTRWLAEERKLLFTSVTRFVNSEGYSYGKIIPKLSSDKLISLFKKINKQKQFFGSYSGHSVMYYHNTPVNWIRAHSSPPYFNSERDGEGISSQLKTFSFENPGYSKAAMDIICSSLFFHWWISHSDCYHLNNSELFSFGFTPNKNVVNELAKINELLSGDMQKNAQRRVYVYKTTGRVEYDEFYMKLSKAILNKIDTVLAHHYGFTEEELDFIINYDIKYRMGDELNTED